MFGATTDDDRTVDRGTTARDGTTADHGATPAHGATVSRRADMPLAVAGLSRLSTCDWPGKLVATVFLQGCPWDCGYCHNPALIDSRVPGTIAWSDVLAFLAGRVGLLDGVVFSGGEPTRQDLRRAIEEVRSLGLQVGLHTMGAFPSRLRQVLPVVDWVGFDVKALPSRYPDVTRRVGAWRRAEESLRYLVDSATAYEVRTTWGPGIMNAEEAAAVVAWLRNLGVASPRLQAMRTEGVRREFAWQVAVESGSGKPVTRDRSL